jgi:phosphatidylserine decarboxylase precursor
VKPGRRPVASITDDRVVVSPADSTFVGHWDINENAEITAEEPHLDLKGLKWSIHQLLEGSDYADRFKGGIFTHAFLDVTDYHRWHSPVQGKILEARVIQGQVYMDVNAKSEPVDGKEDMIANVVDGLGFQFVQTRGLIVLDSPIGLVACLPVGMAFVSSVVITAEVGQTLRKGEEMGYFAFGGSDFVMVFERSSNVQLICQPNVHYNQGTLIGTADPAR